MKKIMVFLLLLMVLCLTACRRDTSEVGSQPKTEKTVTVEDVFNDIDHVSDFED